MTKIGRNDPCPCGSGKKYKKCHPGEYDPEIVVMKRLPEMSVVGCWIGGDYDTLGLSPVIVVRKDPSNSRLTIAGFICDFFCLGVKDVLFERNTTEGRLSYIVDAQPQDMVTVSYEDARGLILGSVRYAQELGFSPHPQYEQAKVMIDSDKPFEYYKEEFGRDGRPFYYTGPNDNYRQIFATLERTCGKGNFDYEIDESVRFTYD